MTTTAGVSSTRTKVVGTISSASFASGDQFVVGNWPQSPVGPICDVMWLDSTDSRTLIASSEAAATFITSIYEFDRVTVADLTVESDGRTTTVQTDGLTLNLVGGRLRPIPLGRPLWLTRFIEAPIARQLMGVETYGTSPMGAREWYQSRGWRWVQEAHATHDGADLGQVVDNRPMNVGFSDPPPRASIVSVNVSIELPAKR